MATDNVFITGHSAAKPLAGADRVFLLEKVCDFAGKTLVAADIYPALQVKKDWVVLQTRIEMVTAAVGTALTADIGDGAGATSFDAAIDLKGAAGTEYSSLIGTDAYVAGGAGKRYAADDTIDIKLNTVTAVTGNPKVIARALVLDLS